MSSNCSTRWRACQFVNFLPAASDDARKRMRREVRRWRLHLRPDKTISDLPRIFNPIIQGWINYYGRFYRSVLIKVLRRINAYPVRWAQCKYKRLRRYPAKARRFLVDVFLRQPGLFAHWRFGTPADTDARRSLRGPWREAARLDVETRGIRYCERRGRESLFMVTSSRSIRTRRMAP